jgi:GPI mannosyltransferase 2
LVYTGFRDGKGKGSEGVLRSKSWFDAAMMQQRQRRRWNRFPESNPIQTLFYVFVIWKALLLLIAILSPGLGYDTSTLLLGENNDRPRPPPATDGEREQEWLSRGTLRGVDKLVRWDAIYFAKIAERGYLFEQEWAFGWGFTRLIALLSKGDTGVATGD